MRFGVVAIVAGLGLLGLCQLAGPARLVAAEGAPNLAPGDPQRGKYVLELGQCAGCHGQNLAGWRAGGPPEQPESAPFGELFAGPFGTAPARNITPDRETGVGSWTDEQLIEAIRNGREPKGSQLFPIMPYLTFHFMSDQDVSDLVAFLRTVPPVGNRVPERNLTGPLPPLPPLPPSPAQAPTSGLDRGGYLANAVVGCGDCHTPLSTSGAPDRSRQLAGWFVPRAEGRFEIAPNITPDPTTGIGRWSSEDIIHLLKTGERPFGLPPVKGLMKLVIEEPPLGGLNQLTDSDAQAITAYLRSIPPISNVAQPPGPPAPPPQAQPSPFAAPSPAPAVQPAQVPRALPRTGSALELAGLVGALGVTLAAGGVAIHRRRRRD